MAEWNPHGQGHGYGQGQGQGHNRGARPPYNVNEHFYPDTAAGSAGYNDNYGQAAWYDRRGVSYNNPRQYIGFDEFVNQFRQPLMNEVQFPARNDYPNPSNGTYDRPTSSSNDTAACMYGNDVPNYPETDFQNTQRPQSERLSGSRRFDRNRPDESSEIVKMSQTFTNTRLTPFAKEFVPQNITKSNRDEAPPPRNSKENYRPKNDRPKKFNNDWRRRDEDSIADEIGAKTFTVYNSRRVDSQEIDESESANYKNRNKTNNRNRSKYNEAKRDVEGGSDRNCNGKNQSDDRYENDGGGGRYNKQKSSYNTGETFRQRDFQRGSDLETDERRPKYNNYSKRETVKYKNDSEITQRERLVDQLNKGALECLVCCERVRQLDHVWSCSNCFHVLHLKCVTKWAMSSLTEGRWRCPACQNKLTDVPLDYLCFCGKRRNPEWSRSDTAHTCGDPCGKTVICDRHPCTLLCHPGPCPQCDATIQKFCECGATSKWLRCSNTQPLLCGGVCNKSLNCKTHLCQEKCHSGPCKPCEKIVEQTCYCVKNEKRSVNCDADTIGVEHFSCSDICDKMLGCGNHHCTKVCHDGPCDECALTPEKIKQCPCGQTLLTEEQQRTSCLEEIPKCGKVCSKILNCGPPNERHTCPKNCHDGDCPPCEKKTSLPCRCGHINKNIPCVNLENERFNVRCEKKCTKKQSCGKHRCKTLCCIDIEHRCPLPCTRTLSCGIHKCDATCHSGHCGTCFRVSFEELRCRCGASVRYPPVECGARPPECSRQCPEVRPCGHEPLHQCHATPACPPCVVLTEKYCYGRHEVRKAIPCHQKEFSCGMPCGKSLSCGKHKCIEVCHKEDCPTTCKQPCEVTRSSCGHRCAAQCGHEDQCPSNSPCKVMVQSSCACGRLKLQRLCSENMKDLAKIQAGGITLVGPTKEPVDINALILRGNNTTTLECDEECHQEDRNRRLAIGLQIRNPDISAKLIPRYSDSLKQFAIKDENFCNKVHEALTQLVTLAQNSKQKTRSHSFQPMNWQKRQFIHEICQHFGCESQAYDSEPYRNIVATAYREKSWLPALSLMEVIRRDKGQRRIPGPIMTASSSSKASSSAMKPIGNILKPSNSGSAWATLGSISKDSDRVQSKPKIDYFDNPPE